MSFQIKPLAALYTTLEREVLTEFKFSESHAQTAIKKLQDTFKNFKKDLWVGIETSYIDKLYRDTYYHYYSSKLKYYSRETIRLTFFAKEISINEFYSKEGQAELQKQFLGFVVLRPTTQNIFGRNVVSPDIFTRTETYHACTACYEICVYGAKMIVQGFPHSSQDGEFMVCAETTVWSLLEYFSTKYAEYHPVLPKTIHQILSVTSMQRQVPSSGLTALQISYALKELGFGVKNYISNTFDFKTIIKIYIESGIPVVIAIKNDKGVAHVFNLSGRTAYQAKGFAYTALDTLADGVDLLNYYEPPARYLAMDDNQAPYDSILLDDPACNYTNENWKDCTIVAAIIPLHRRIYKDAQKAQSSAIQHLKWLAKHTTLPPDVVLRLLLSSSRSFKSSIAQNPDLPSDIKTLILGIDMPKFVWIAEIGTPDSYNVGQATGMILMDATEPNKSENLACFLENTYIGIQDGKIGIYSITLPPFRMHTNLNSI
ncbi:hypothetical protein [Sediminibacterium sp.]|uniref:hypothetical protein n=1 Tax=Sediminibacterium sp. TaxID=1917865 RepID=UPI00272FE332|nr:hypothetical protein [Sediminibacterium sp.]MDP2421333.1 hypothetical protein [Sediminibacterium sp.]